MDNTKNYNKSEELKPYEWFWLPTGKVGSKECRWVHYTKIPIFKQLKARVDYFDGFIKAFGGMTKVQLEKNGKRGTKSAAGNVYQIFDNMEVILKDEEVHAMQFGALGKYVTSYIDASHIYHGELPEDFSADGTWYKNENGVYVRDMQKVAEAVL